MLLASDAYGQSPFQRDLEGFWITPSVRTAAVKEDNLLFTGDNRSAGAFLRVTPTIDARYRNPRHVVELAYAFDAERHPSRRAALDSLLARQAATGTIDSALSPRSQFSGRARYISTLRPEEVVEDTGLVFERRRAIAFTGNASLTHNITPRLQWRAAYDINHEDYGEPSATTSSTRTYLHAASTGLTFNVAPRTRLAAEYTGRRLLGDDLSQRFTVHGEFTAHVLALRLTRSITPSLTAVLLAGPRVSQVLPTQVVPGATTALPTETAPEVLASLTFRRGPQRLSAAYTRSQFIGFGASGFVDTESLDVRGVAVIADRIQMSVRPAVYRNTLLDTRARAYRLDGGIVVRLTGWVNLDGSYVYRHQDRSLTLADALAPGAPKPRTRQTIVVGLTIRRTTQLQ